jgi:GntR family transcriptional repressor for pyruvate dehydrogenase complex
MSDEETTFRKLNHQPAYKQLAGEVAKLVMSRSLRHGDPLPTEAALCVQFGVNRSTVREGIRLLEETGLVRRSGAKRLLISRPTTEEISTQLERAMVLQEVTFEELWETAMFLEPKTAELAATQLGGEELAAIGLNIQNTERAIAAGQSLVKLDIEFHNLIAKAVHNRVLMLTREPMSRLFYPTFENVLSSLPSSGERLLVAHKAIFEALTSRAPADAANWMTKHIKDFRRGYEATGLDMQAAINPVSIR